MAIEVKSPLTPQALAAQEEIFRECYAKGDIYLARALYHPDLVYVSPTFRIIDRPSFIMIGIDPFMTSMKRLTARLN